nr:glutamate receptor ionotropic, kainate 5-like [Penaeus vannamei]
MAELFPVLMAYLGRCYEWVVPEPRVFGYKHANGSWAGIIGLVARGEADLSVPLSITTERLAAVDFTEPVFIDEFAIAYKLPSLKSDIRGFIKPFSPVLWLMLFLSVMFVCVSTWLLLRSYAVMCFDRIWILHITSFERLKVENDMIQGETTVKSEQPRGPCCGHCPLGAHRVRPKDPGRPVAPGGFILGVVYRGNLKAMLILPTLELPFNNLQELADSDEVIWSPRKPRGPSVAHDLSYGALARRPSLTWTYGGLRRMFEENIAVLAPLPGFVL